MAARQQHDETPSSTEQTEDGKVSYGSGNSLTQTSSEEKDAADQVRKRPRWSLGILADKHTDEVPGSVLLLSKFSEHNAPLGLNSDPARTSSTSLPSVRSGTSSVSRAMFGRYAAPAPEVKKTADGKIILEPQPDDSMNDPLNWSTLRRDAALLSVGFYCMMGGGMTPVLAAGFTDVSETFNVSIPQVALTTGLYMLGLGVGSVIASPTAIAFGKRPVYLVGAFLFVLTAVWCALSNNYPSLVVARVIMGIAVSPVECLPSATIAEIFFLHERAYRLGIYTLLLLGGKNLIPLVSAAIIQSLGWRWVFWIVALVVAFCFCLLFFFVPETFWDRTPRPHKPHHIRRPSLSGLRRITGSMTPKSPGALHDFIRGKLDTPRVDGKTEPKSAPAVPDPAHLTKERKEVHAHFAASGSEDSVAQIKPGPQSKTHKVKSGIQPDAKPHERHESESEDYFSHKGSNEYDAEAARPSGAPLSPSAPETPMHYTRYYRHRDPKTFVETLKPYSGRLNQDNWFRVAFRPFVLFAYPAILWSAAVYALSVGWLIVLSESVSTIYRDPDSYNFSAISTGVVYISPFVGGVLGTAVAGKVSDIIVRFISRRNEGIYEPEFRLVMAVPVAITTTIGLMGYGWSAQERDNFWVPTIFFGIISFGCSLGSTTAITFAVDSYRQYAGEALVTLNFSKNIFHGLVFSLFFNSWLDSDGSKIVFLSLGGIQLFFLLFTIPMYIFGKRARMWTVRKNLMERF